MPSQSEKQRRKQIMQQLQAAATTSLLSTLPLSLEQLKGLFDYLDEKLSACGCDDTLHFTEQFSASGGVLFEPLRAWLENLGGYCDCEVLANVEEKFEKLF